MFVQGMAAGSAFRLTAPESQERLEIIGRSPVMRKLFRELRTICASEAPVLIEGETGVGKSVLALALHQIGPRAAKPFVTLGAADLGDTRFLRELFEAARTAAGGTLFLDEIGELTAMGQTEMLTFLDRREVRAPAGRALPVDLRVLCASNRDLGALVEAGAFRRDLYYRIRGIAVRVPALCERLEDLPLLVDHFIARFERRYGKSVAGIDEGAMARLREHRWGGNVRELENEVERAVLLTPEGQAIAAEGLSLEAASPAADQGGDGEVAVEPGDGESLLAASRLAAERSVIAEALRRNAWNVSAAARELGISRVGLTRKLKRLGLRRPGQDR